MFNVYEVVLNNLHDMTKKGDMDAVYDDIVFICKGFVDKEMDVPQRPKNNVDDWFNFGLDMIMKLYDRNALYYIEQADTKEKALLSAVYEYLGSWTCGG